jgi:hypothetical protein
VARPVQEARLAWITPPVKQTLTTASSVKALVAHRYLRRCNMSPKTQPEPHFTASDIVHDIVIGMSDGLTVPFAIAPGMSGVAVASQVVVVAGLAEITAGSISMGLGGYLSGRTDAEHYDVERKREEQETFL